MNGTLQFTSKVTSRGTMVAFLRVLRTLPRGTRTQMNLQWKTWHHGSLIPSKKSGEEIPNIKLGYSG